ncbi:MAG: MBG domain-containing protein, partial [Chitinophagaceae bacterium]
SGLPVLSTLASATSAVGSYDIVTGMGSLSSHNYTFILNKGTLTIGKAILAITADNKSRKYGELNPALTFQASGFKNGQVWATSGINGVPSVTTTADVKSGAGSYTITASMGTLSSTNYDFEFASGSLVIEKALLTISVENKGRTYGQANPALTANYAGFMNGESLSTSDLSGQLDLSTLATPSSPAGAYAITANAASLSSNNYAFSITPGTLAIGKAMVTITAESKGRSYGVANPQLTVIYNGLMNGETLATSGITGQPALSTNAASNSPVGTYDINVGVGNLSSNNYSFQFNKGVLSIGRATITYVATNASKVYGEAMPRLSFTTFGYVNEETSATSDISGSPVVSTVATASSAAGSYDIVIQKGSLTSNNYIFNFVNGTLTVNKAIVTITAENKGRVYGQANPEFTATYAGFVNGETLATSGILGTPYLYTDAIPTSEVGNYAINASVGTLTAPNYTFNFVPGILKIARTAITITAETKSRVYGTDNPELTYVFSGFAPGESLASSDITGDLDISTTATINSPAGSYPIVLSQGSLYSNNYVFNIVSGSLRITKAPLTIIAENKSKI